MLDWNWSRWLGVVNARQGARRRLVPQAAIIEHLESRQLLSAAASPREVTHVFWGEFSDVTITEGDANTKTLTLRIFSSPQAKKNIKVTGEFTIAGTGAGFADEDDFNAVPFTATIPKGEASTTVQVTINGDTIVESNEVFSAVIKKATGAVIDNPDLPVTIINDDQGGGGGLPKVSFATGATTISATEGQSQEFTLKLDEESDVDVQVTINLATASKTDTGFPPASIPADANFGEGDIELVVTIPAHTLTKTFSVPLIDDNTTEEAEGYAASIVSAVNATPLGKTTQFAVILDNDALPEISVAASTEATEGSEGTTTLMVTISLNHATDHDVTVRYAPANDNSVPTTRRAKKNKDFVLKPGTATIAAGQTSTTIAIQIVGDTSIEEVEQFLIKLSRPKGATLLAEDAKGTVLIFDNDAP